MNFKKKKRKKLNILMLSTDSIYNIKVYKLFNDSNSCLYVNIKILSFTENSKLSSQNTHDHPFFKYKNVVIVIILIT